MEINEHIIFQDIPSGGKKGKYHSAVLTTYAIDLLNFDKHIINTIHRKQICSVNVLADQEQVTKAMEYVNPRYLDKVGKDYSITQIGAKGAFHPKINLFVGDESVIIIFGSGNLTVTGQGKNHEIFTGFWIDSDNAKQRPLIEECWRYILKFISQCSDFEKNRILNEIPANCIYLDSSYEVRAHQFLGIDNHLDAALLYNDDSSILFQMEEKIPMKDVVKLTVISPFFDEDGETLITLAGLCPNAELEVLIQQDCVLPPCKMKAHDRIHFYNFDETERGKKCYKDFERKLHAKIFHFKTKSKDYCVIGSANATVAGVGTIEKRGINDEFCVLYASDRHNFLGSLGITIRKSLSINLRDMKRLVTDSPKPEKLKYIIHGADYDNGKIRIDCDRTPHEDAFVSVDNGREVYADKVSVDKEGKVIVNCNIGNLIVICYLSDNKGQCVSNKVFVNRIDLLETTNPSHNSRSMNRFISQIDNEGYDGLEVADMLTEIMWNLVNETDENETVRISASTNGSDKKDPYLPQIKYNADFDNDDVHTRKYLNIDKSSRLMDCIEESIRRKLRSIDEDMKDEEESGNTESSNERSEINDDIVIKENYQIVDYGKKVISILDKYSNLIDKRNEQNRKKKMLLITKDDLNFFSLSLFASMEIGYLNRSRYVFPDYDSYTKSQYQKKLYDSLDKAMQNNAFNVIEKFKIFCQNNLILDKTDRDYQKKSTRVLKYAVLYATLFHKFASEFDEKLKGWKVDKCIKTLFDIFDVLETEKLLMELEPISERYNYIFRTSHVKKLLQKIIDS